MIRSLTGEIPFLPREAKLGWILARLEGPAPAAFVLAGPVGVGKTRLAAEVARSAAALGYATAQAVGSRAAAAIPFGPFGPFGPFATLPAAVAAYNSAAIWLDLSRLG